MAAGAFDLQPHIKCGSVVRRIPRTLLRYCKPAPAFEGDVAVFRLPADAEPAIIESTSGRAMTLVGGDLLVGAPAYRESTRWVVGSIPPDGLLPGGEYWILADSGIVGRLLGDSPREKGHLARVQFLGTVRDPDRQALTLSRFALPPAPEQPATAPQVFLIVGTAAEVGKTTAAINVLRALRRTGRDKVLALKATGTCSLTELHTYEDHGAFPCLDAIDFGLPTTYPSDRDDIGPLFETMLAWSLAQPVNAVLIECGGDIFGANVPVFLRALRRRRPDAKVVLVAADTPAALGARAILDEMGLCPIVVTGPCTDTPAIQARTQAHCGIPAINMARGGGLPF